MSVTITGKAALADSEYSTRTGTNYIVMHCAETPKSWDGDISEVRKWHVEERGWKDVGYHYFIQRDGTIERGRPPWALGSHVHGHNADSIGVCMAGGCDEHGKEENNFTPAQWASAKALVQELLHLYPHAQLRGHRDFEGVTKYCPSFDTRAWWMTNG